MILFVPSPVKQLSRNYFARRLHGLTLETETAVFILKKDSAARLDLLGTDRPSQLCACQIRTSKGGALLVLIT